MTLLRGTLAVLSTMVVVLSIYPACPAQAATARDPKFQPNLERTVRYLQNAQRENGGFAEPGSEPGSDFTAWVALALAAAGINPRDQTTAKQHYAAGHSAYTYLAEHAHEASSTTDFERELLVVNAAGGTPHDFGGVDLAGEILALQITHGSQAGAFPHQAGSSEPGINDTIFAILALSPIHEQPVQEAVARASAWLERQQNCDGSWNTLDPREVRPCARERRLLAGEADGEVEVDMTGAAIEALYAAGRTDREGQAEAFEFLHEEQVPNGGFSEFPGEHEPNVASTAWVLQAMWSARVNPETWVTRSGARKRRTPELPRLDATGRRPHPLGGKPGTKRHVDDRIRHPGIHRQPIADPRSTLRTSPRAAPRRTRRQRRRWGIHESGRRGDRRRRW